MCVNLLFDACKRNRDNPVVLYVCASLVLFFILRPLPPHVQPTKPSGLYYLLYMVAASWLAGWLSRSFRGTPLARREYIVSIVLGTSAVLVVCACAPLVTELPLCRFNILTKIPGARGRCKTLPALRACCWLDVSLWLYEELLVCAIRLPVGIAQNDRKSGRATTNVIPVQAQLLWV